MSLPESIQRQVEANMQKAKGHTVTEKTDRDKPLFIKPAGQCKFPESNEERIIRVLDEILDVLTSAVVIVVNAEIEKDEG